MARIEYRVCDKCGAIIEKNSSCLRVETAHIPVTRSGIDYAVYDICPKCEKKLIQFMNSKED